jgi:hypothetical protein
MTQPANVALTIENVFSPQSLIGNPIGFQTLPTGFRYEYPAGTTNTLQSDYPLHGLMNIRLSNVFIQRSNGFPALLSDRNAVSLGMVTIHGNVVNVNYGPI